MSNKVELAKDGLTGFMAAVSMVGLTPDDFPLFLAITVGLVGGTAAAWSREAQNGHRPGLGWLWAQATAWLLIAVIVSALAEYPGLSVRWSGAVAALGAFASREGLLALQRRTVREIEKRNS